MNELKFYLLMNHNHTSHNGAGCPVVFSGQDNGRAYTQALPPLPKRSAKRMVSTLWHALRERIAPLARPQLPQAGEQFRRDALEL